MGDECEIGLKNLGIDYEKFGFDIWIGYVNFDGFGERVIFLMIVLREMLDFCWRNGVEVGV